MCSSMHLDNGLDANVRSDWINRARLSHGSLYGDAEIGFSKSVAIMRASAPMSCF